MHRKSKRDLGLEQKRRSVPTVTRRAHSHTQRASCIRTGVAVQFREGERVV